MNDKQLEALCNDIKLWARTNFNNNQSKADESVVLGPVAPLLGIVEEIGELIASTDREEQLDGFGDFLIFSVDYFSRMPEEFTFTEAFNLMVSQASEAGARTPFVVLLGDFCQINLKMHQGIRGMDDMSLASIKAVRAWAKLAYRCYSVLFPDAATTAMVRDRTLKQLNETWTSIVAKRNWVANPETAGQSTVTPTPTPTVEITNETQHPETAGQSTVTPTEPPPGA